MINKLKAALEALEMQQTGLTWYRGMMPEYVDGSDDEADAQVFSSITDLRTVIAQLAQAEPVAHINQNGVVHTAGCEWFGLNNHLTPLYAHPAAPVQPKAEPLTDEQWQEIADITGSIITRRGKDAIEKCLGITKD